MNEREMFEKSFQRPTDYLKLTPQQQWSIDSKLGILDWQGLGLTDEDREKMKNHYK